MRDDEPAEKGEAARETYPMRLRLKVGDMEHVMETTMRRIDRNMVQHHEAVQGGQAWQVKRKSEVGLGERIEITIDATGRERHYLYRGAERIEIGYDWVCVEEPDENIYRPSILLDCLVPFDRAKDMHANLEDIYPVWVERHGAAKAVWIKRWQVALLIGGTWWEKLLSATERLLKVMRLSG